MLNCYIYFQKRKSQIIKIIRDLEKKILNNDYKFNKLSIVKNKLLKLRKLWQ